MTGLPVLWSVRVVGEDHAHVSLQGFRNSPTR